MYLIPKKIIKYSNVENVYSLKRAKENQISILEEDFITAGKDSYFILDFGKETSGGIRILTYETHADETKHIRIRFGESVAERNRIIDHKVDHAVVVVFTISSTNAGSLALFVWM